MVVTIYIYYTYTDKCFWISTTKISTAGIDNTKDYVFQEFGQSSDLNSTSLSTNRTFDSSLDNHNVPQEAEESNFDYAAEILPIQSVGNDEQQIKSDFFQSVVNDSISSIREIHSHVQDQKESRKKLQGKNINIAMFFKLQKIQNMTQKYLLYETCFSISDIIGRAEMKIIQDKVAQKKESKATFRVIYNHCTVPSKLIYTWFIT